MRCHNGAAQVHRDTATLLTSTCSCRLTCKCNCGVFYSAGTLIRIKKRAVNTNEYICHKGFAALNIQIVCGPNKEIYHISAEWPGRAHDALVFSQSTVPEHYQQNHEFQLAFLPPPQQFLYSPRLMSILLFQVIPAYFWVILDTLS